MEEYVPYWALREHIPGAIPLNYDDNHREKCRLTPDATEYIKSSIISDDKARILTSISVNKREALIGWQILILGGDHNEKVIGLAVITAVRKRHGCHTEHRLSTEIEDFWVRLQRGCNSCGVPFRPLRRVSLNHACSSVEADASSPHQHDETSSFSTGMPAHLPPVSVDISYAKEMDKKRRAEMLRTLNSCYQYYNATVPLSTGRGEEEDAEECSSSEFEQYTSASSDSCCEGIALSPKSIVGRSPPNRRRRAKPVHRIRWLDQNPSSGVDDTSSNQDPSSSIEDSSSTGSADSANAESFPEGGGGEAMNVV
eukprot:CAMPEP_0174970500 /NCGR_PEP_ID=MMETSP0004_2-20121128/9420_1 /TAXON_ID=420556 /ORGANISM="Ochromonas sp., Strain CCMP1393" /LENGTH=311 /DNA_ID=CAMNT_0016220243 /DNA_START=45 /DNA_END=980 /DNA_ORIENTATION=-